MSKKRPHPEPQPQSLKAVVKHAVEHSATHPTCPPLCEHMERSALTVLASIRGWVTREDVASRERLALMLDVIASELDGSGNSP